MNDCSSVPESWPSIDRSGSAPLWRQILSDIEFEIRSGLIGAGQKLPSELELTRRYGVNRHTVRMALLKLADKGLVVSRQGVGVFVTNEHADYRVPPRSNSTELEQAMDDARTGELIASYRRPAPACLADLLQIDEGSELLVLETLRQNGPRLLAYGYHYFEAARFAGLDAAFVRLRSLSGALAERGCRILRRRATWIDARMPRKVEANALSIDLDEPVIVLSYVDENVDGQPVIYGNSVLRGGSVRVRVEAA